MDDISIDRLILEIPGLTGAGAEDLARRFGAQLAVATKGPGIYDHVAVTLDPDPGGVQALHPERLATSIVAALLRQIG